MSRFAAFIICTAITCLGLIALPVVAEESTTQKKSAPVDKAPAFTLPDVDGKKHSLADYKGKWVVLEWINHDCPFVKKHYDAGTMQALQKKYGKKGVVWLSICSSAPGKQGHFSSEGWKKRIKEKKSTATAVLLDPAGTVGMKYKAKKTPHMYIVDPKGNFVYRGAIDDRPRAFEAAQVKGARNYVAEVLDAVLAGKKAPIRETQAYGCSVKYGEGVQ